MSLVGAGMPAAIEVLSEVRSTQDVVRAWVSEGRPHGAALRALRQTGGRGRLGRAWVSPPGALALSILLRPALPPNRLGLLMLGAGVALRQACGEALRLKWPNDLLMPDGRKVGGILAEAEHLGGRVAVVLGVGVNVEVAPEGGGALAELGGGRTAGQLAEVVRERVLDMVERAARDPEGLLADWVASSCTIGRRVRVASVEGIATGVDPDGALRVRAEDGEVRITAGDVQMVGGA